MEPDSHRRSPERVGPLGHQGGDDTGQHIPAAALGQSAATGGVHQNVPLRRRRDGPVALQHQNAAMGHGEVLCRPFPVPTAQIAADPGELHLMGRQDRGPAPAGIQ